MSPPDPQDLHRLADRPRLRVDRVDVEVLRHAPHPAMLGRMATGRAGHLSPSVDNPEPGRVRAARRRSAHRPRAAMPSSRPPRATAERVVFFHTEVSPAYEGQGLAGRLAAARARRRPWRLAGPSCACARTSRSTYRRHEEEYAEHVAAPQPADLEAVDQLRRRLILARRTERRPAEDKGQEPAAPRRRSRRSRSSRTRRPTASTTSPATSEVTGTKPPLCHPPLSDGIPLGTAASGAAGHLRGPSRGPRDRCRR